MSEKDELDPIVKGVREIFNDLTAQRDALAAQVERLTAERVGRV